MVDDSDEEAIKSDFSNRIGRVEAKIIEFLASSSDSDVKSISKAIGLRPSRTSDYLKRLVDAGVIESSGEWRKIYRISNVGKATE